MPDGVILEHERACERSVGVERQRRRPIEFRVAESPDGGRGSRAVAPEQIERDLFRHGVVLRGVPGIHLVDDIHRHAHHGVAGRERLCQMDLHRVHAGDVMHDDADLAPILRDAYLPLGFREGAGGGDKSAGPLFETIGEGVGALPRLDRRRM
jgi:hypothetical protein